MQLHSLKWSLNHHLANSLANFTLESPLCNFLYNRCPSPRQTAVPGKHSWKQQTTRTAPTWGHSLDSRWQYPNKSPTVSLYPSMLLICLFLCTFLKVSPCQVRPYWQRPLWFWEKPQCHQTLPRSTGGWRKTSLHHCLSPFPLYHPLFASSIHFSGIVVIASSPKQRPEQPHAAFSMCVHTRVESLHIHIVVCVLTCRVRAGRG